MRNANGDIDFGPLLDRFQDDINKMFQSGAMGKIKEYFIQDVFKFEVGEFESHVCVDESKLLPYWKKDEDGTSGTKLKFQFYVQNPNGSQQCFDMPAARIWFLEEIAKDDPIELSSDKTVAHGMHIDDCINRKYLRFKLIGPNIGENGCGGHGMCRHKENGGVECWRPGVFCWDTELRDCDDAWHRVHDDASLAPNFRTALEEFAKEWGKFKANNFKTKRGIKVSVALQY